MDKISLDIRLRPVRFAFIVRPDDKARLLRIFQINTCLWGGKLNSIIPFFKRVPPWWAREGFNFENAAQILNGYLDFFEPDFVVEAEKGLATGLGFQTERVLQLSKILLPDNDRREEGYGMGVLDLYRQLYKEEYQFVRRHKQKFAWLKAKSREFDAFAACLGGSFPTQAKLKYFGKAFKDAFDAEEIALDPQALKKLYQSRVASPLWIGQSNLTVDYHDQYDPALFVLDAREPRDLIDYWNYRAIHGNVRAVPIQWLPEVSDFCRSMIVKSHRPLPGNPHGVMITAKVMFSRSIPEKDIESIYVQHFKVDKPDANAYQPWYPPFWRPAPRFTFQRRRPIVEYKSKKVDLSVDLDNPLIQFETLYPSFAERFGNNYRWANVIRLQDWSHKDRLATVFPCNFKNPSTPKFTFGELQPLPTTEGIIIFPKFKDFSELWQLSDGANALSLWLKEHQITSHLSEAGRATQQIIQTMGGFYGVRNLASEGIVRLLDEMARSPVTRSAHRDEFRNKVKAAVGDHIWRDKVFERLVERKAVELGYELKCSKCGSWSWYRLPQLGTTMTCELCLRNFEFPATDPANSKHARWAYRVIGPFALPDYARGGYASALSIRFFADVVGRRLDSAITWSPGQELTFASGDKVEADFMLWFQRRHHHGLDDPTETIFGEAKSFGKVGEDVFTEKDVSRMKLLAQTFPGSILVFATMRDASQLTRDEVARVRKLAQWGREYDQNRQQTRAPVVVLTGTELFAAHDLSQAWKEKGGKHEQLIAPAYVRVDELRTLADLTQHLYLDMPRYDAWRQQVWAKKRQSIAKRRP